MKIIGEGSMVNTFTHKQSSSGENDGLALR